MKLRRRTCAEHYDANRTQGHLPYSERVLDNRMVPIYSQSPPQTPPTTHSRTPSFFSFRSRPRTLSHSRSSSMGSLDHGRNPMPQQPPNHQPQEQRPSTSPVPVNRQSPQLSPQTPTLHPEIRSIVNLTAAHAHKIYFSGPLVRRIERQPDGTRPSRDEGWTDVWAQLGGTILSIWDTKQIQEASKENRQVPPTYMNITDAVRFFHVPLPSIKYHPSSSKFWTSSPRLAPQRIRRRNIPTFLH